MITINPKLSKGIFTRTRYNPTTCKIELSSRPGAPTDPSDTSNWVVSGAPWTKEGDWYVKDNQTSANDYIQYTAILNQTYSAPTTLRIRAKAQDIKGPADGGFSIFVVATYTSQGLSGDLTEVQTYFPPGTWSERQIVCRIEPRKPITFLYVYVFARYKTGKVWIKDLELVSDAGDTSEYGEWISETIDLSTMQSGETSTGTLKPMHIGYAYGDIGNVDNMESIEHSVDVLSKFDLVVISPPAQLSARGTTVLNALKAKSKLIYGYVHLATTEYPLTDAEIAARVDDCAASVYNGMLFDTVGYGYGVSRTRFNAAAAKVHSYSGMHIMVNGWDVDEWLTNKYDATYNPTSLAGDVIAGDWAIEESMFTRSDNKYSGEPGGNFFVTMEKYLKALVILRAAGVKCAGLDYHFTTKPITDTTNQTTSYLLSMLMGLDGWTYTQIQADNNKRWNIMPPMKLGASYIGTVTQVAPLRWERTTDQAVIWFEASDIPLTRSAGLCPLITGVDTSALTVMPTISDFSAERVTLLTETSSDRNTWSAPTTTTNRFVRLRAILQR